jgi:hypothetical protein
MPDGWEIQYGLNPSSASDAGLDLDGDGLPNLQEYQWGANPTNPDTDGDGALDGDEKDGNTNPKDPESAPQEGWIVLTGDQAKGERKAIKRTVTIPKGQTRLVMVALHSEEYPEYTEYDSEFDDVLEWKITPTAGTAIAGQTNVNDKHADWQLADAEGTTIKNFYPVHIEKVSSLTAPPETDLTVTLELAATNISDGALPSTVMVGLLPVEVKVVREGQTAAPEDGLVVKKSDTVRYRLSPGLPDTPLLLEDKIRWHWRILKWDGTYSGWTAYENGQGHTFTAQPEDAGIYEVKASMDGQDFFLKRAEDDPYSAKKKDENECFGVVDEQWQINVRNQAKANFGSVAYAFAVANGSLFGKKTNKCNLFVYHKAKDGGAAVPIINGNYIKRYPPTANQWAGTEAASIPGWSLLSEETYPQPGYVVARGVAGKTGHTGFIDYDGAWIGAGPTNVNRKADLRNDISRRSGPTIYQPARFRKYTPVP